MPASTVAPRRRQARARATIPKRGQRQKGRHTPDQVAVGEQWHPQRDAVYCQWREEQPDCKDCHHAPAVSPWTAQSVAVRACCRVQPVLRAQSPSPATNARIAGSSEIGALTGNTPRLKATASTDRISPKGTNGWPVSNGESHISACHRSRGEIRQQQGCQVDGYVSASAAQVLPPGRQDQQPATLGRAQPARPSKCSVEAEGGHE